MFAIGILIFYNKNKRLFFGGLSMEKTMKKNVLQEMIEQLDLPDSIDVKVRDRYASLSKWFSREESALKGIDIDIFAQGSFAMGTTIKPLMEEEDYDLDMGCKLNIANFKDSHTQEELKNIIGEELKLYKNRVGIDNPVDEKRRCWRLEYKDEVRFHLDIVPCIPLENEKKTAYEARLFEANGYDKKFNQDVAQLAVSITDTENKNYNAITDDWNISNPQGYVRWFQERMQKNQTGLFESRTSVEPVPKYEQKAILQRCIQLFKRHRDNMFIDKIDSKPISIIITTLAAQAYEGEQDLGQAILSILNKMPNYIRSQKPRIPNPVKPEEDFTDRWDNPDFKALNLEGNFKAWLMQAKSDFNKLIETEKASDALYIIEKRFSLNMSQDRLVEDFGYQPLMPAPVKVITTVPPTKPWCL